VAERAARVGRLPKGTTWMGLASEASSRDGRPRLCEKCPGREARPDGGSVGVVKATESSLQALEIAARAVQLLCLGATVTTVG
jgi:hypothetical protein